MGQPERLSSLAGEVGGRRHLGADQGASFGGGGVGWPD